MATKTNDVRLAIQSRLASLRVENNKASNIQAVLNPIEARQKSNIPTTGRYAVLWTLDGQSQNGNASAVLWKQDWAVDIPVEWEVDTEQLLDQIKVELASALLPKIDGVKEQSLGSLQISYPAGGSGRAVVSIEFTTVYVETLS
jgi:hypothetical protein